MKCFLEDLERVCQAYPDAIAVADEVSALSYRDVLSQAKRLGSHLAHRRVTRKPYAIYMDKTPALAASMMGVLYSGNFYVVLDSKMPVNRILKIFETLEPVGVITDEAHKETALLLGAPELVLYEEALTHPVEGILLSGIRQAMTAEDPMYALYTSGSTGQPKGALVSHRAAIAYTDWFIKTFHINEETVFGSQTPFYFSMSVSDLLSTLRTGARLQIIPKEKFSFPLPLIEYMNQTKINTIYWVPSALCILANWDAFAYAKPEYLKMVLFAGEVMPNKQLNYWRKHLPKVYYANLFGPTETTDICCWYPVTKLFRDEQSLPIGYPCDDCRIWIVDEEGKEAKVGELLVGGPFLAHGYYNNPEKTAAAFTQNPLQDAWPEIVYHTGDLVTYGEQGELLYLGRKDFQIKHMGYRIELGEIEANIGALPKITACVCVYDPTQDTIVLLYEGRVKKDVIVEQAKATLPVYMQPNQVIRVKQMPYNANGKIDRKYLSENYKGL